MATTVEGVPGAAVEAPYPASTRSASASIAEIPTTVTRVSFSDKLFITVSQAGRLNHWCHVPLENSTSLDASFLGSAPDSDGGRPDSTLLPSSHLTATTVLGGTKPEFEILGQTLATTIASAVLIRAPEEKRMLVLGVGLERADTGREGFEDLIGLCLEVL